MGDAASKMIDTAERIAATEGLGAMSVRAVQQASGQRNKSAVQYHFGGRDGLVEAVVRTRMGPLNERRTALLLALDTPRTVRNLVEVIVVPLAEAVLDGRRPSYWARFLLQAQADPSVAAVVGDVAEGEAFRVARRHLLDTLDHLPPGLRARRFGNAFSLALLALAAAEANGPADVPALPVADVITDLVDTVVAALTAPSSIPSAALATAGPAPSPSPS